MKSQNRLCIDPGPQTSGTVMLYTACWPPMVTAPEADRDNEILLRDCQLAMAMGIPCVIEKVASYGMPVGEEVFETVFWSGRFAQACGGGPARITRHEVKMALCHSPRANDATIRQAIIDLYGGPDAIKAARKATKKEPGRPAGALFGVKGDAWAALAVGLTWCIQQGYDHAFDNFLVKCDPCP